MSAEISTHLRSFANDDQGNWGWLVDQAVAADRAGVDKVLVSDHVVYGENLDAYGDPKAGGSKGGKQPTGPDGHWLEPLTFNSVVIGRTERVKVSTSILLAALRRPVVLAKMLSTLDVLSGGRVELGVGVGWQAAEYEAAGLDFATRGAQLDHTLAVCQALWTQPVAEFHDDLLDFERIHMQPKPTKAGGIPIWVSGTINGPMLRRLARFGAGWIPWGDDAIDLVGAIPRMRDGLAALGRDPEGVGVVGTLPVRKLDDGSVDIGATIDQVPALLAAGVTDFRAMLPFGSSVTESVDNITPLVEAFRAAVS